MWDIFMMSIKMCVLVRVSRCFILGQCFLILDVDECTFGTHYCDESSHADCINTEGSYMCICKLYKTSENERILIHTLELKLWHFEVFSYGNTLTVAMILCVQTTIHVNPPVSNIVLQVWTIDVHVIVATTLLLTMFLV